MSQLNEGLWIIVGAIIAAGSAVAMMLWQDLRARQRARDQAEAATIERLQKALAEWLHLLRFPQSLNDPAHDDLPTLLEIGYLLERVRDEKARSAVHRLLDTGKEQDARRGKGQMHEEDKAAIEELVDQYDGAQRALGGRYRAVT